ncbi:MAG: anthranilate phosphoribosyltransferase [Clostridiales bacterium]|nr:anthranilate phosphoribosyltransferase [Clostridiales bacterium]
MLKDLLFKVTAGENLTYDEAKSAVEEIMGGECSAALIASFLTALAIKGETDDEIAGSANGMRSRALHFDGAVHSLDIVGTGGDKSNSFNISTTASFVLAAAGVKIAKHGNRAASSQSGAADCLEALGVNVNADSAVMKKAFDEANMCFLFAQKYHSAMRFVGPVRKEIGIRTVFNILGPLTNPAGADMMVLGVFSREYVEKIAKVIIKLGVKDALVVFGLDTFDEISACGETAIAEVRNTDIKYYTIKPEDFGFKRYKKSDLLGGTAQENAAITRAVLAGGGTDAQRTAVILNAGGGIYVDRRGKVSLKEAMDIAAESIDSGRALETLNKFTEITNE